MAELIPPAGFLGPTLGGTGGGGGGVPPTRTLTAGPGLTGGGDLSADRTFSVLAADTSITVAVAGISVKLDAEGSIVVGAGGIKVGVLAFDAEHGNRGGGSLHTIATPNPGGVAGFMSAADKTKLDGLGASLTLSAAYNIGTVAADQTLVLTDARGGGVAINATTPGPGFTGVTAFEIDVIGGSTNFYTRGGFDVASAFSVAAVAGSAWNEVAFLASTVTLTGGPTAVTALAMVNVEAGTVSSAAANTVATAATLAIQGAPGVAGAAAITQPLSFWVRSGCVALEGNTCLGTTTEVASTRLRIDASKTIASAVGAVWNGVHVVDSTATITGVTTPITSLSCVLIGRPQITAANAIAITEFSTLRVGAASFLGTGPASATRSYAIISEGNTKLDGGCTFKGTDINAVGPYTVLETDFFLEIRYTATDVITINLPAISAVANGRVIAVIDSGYNAAVKNITLARNGADKINNVAGNYTMTVSGQCLWLKANATTSNWELV
jgi:hypothetical protein